MSSILELSFDELTSVSGGNSTIADNFAKRAGQIATTRPNPPKPDGGSADPDGNAFWFGFIIGLII